MVNKKTNKKLIMILLTIITLFALSAVFASADVIDPNSKTVPFCAKVINLNDYPDYYFVSVETYPGSRSIDVGNIITSDECLGIKGYKFDSLEIYAINKSYVDSIGIDNIPTINVSFPGECEGGCFKEEFSPENAMLLNESVNLGSSYYVKKSSPMQKMDVELKVTKIGEDFIIYTSKTTISYKNGKTDVKLFVAPTTIPPLPAQISIFTDPLTSEQRGYGQVVSRNIFQNVGCFFKKLFGGAC